MFIEVVLRNLFGVHQALGGWLLSESCWCGSVGNWSSQSRSSSVSWSVLVVVLVMLMVFLLVLLVGLL